MLGSSEAKFLLVVRLAVGWFFFYAGITKILDPAWSAKGYLMGAKTFSGFYGWLASPANIGWVNFLNEWGLTLIGLSLILGLGVRLGSLLGALLMLLYYFPVLEFPKVEHGFIVDDHIIYAAILLFFAAIRAGRYYGLDNWCANLPICRRYPRLHQIWG
jgi:thiosulfate dehydrogenase [quinone] large subunit